VATAMSNRALRGVAIAVAIGLGAIAVSLSDVLPPGARGGLGAVALIALVAACSSNLRAVNWRTVAWGLALQIGLALFILKLQIGDWRPGYALFNAIAAGMRQFLQFTDAGSRLVFGGLADPAAMSQVFPGGYVFAFVGLPTIIFVSAFFTVLYHFGILQWAVRIVARVMMWLMRTSGAETLSAAANVFMGMTEAPLIVKPYVPRMTQSEMLTMMVGGLATIAGSVMAVYLSLGADPVAMLTTSVMAAPCGLYLSKIMLPETEDPDTRGIVRAPVERTHANAIDALAGGAADGTVLAINVAAMLIAFLASLALVDFLLGALGHQAAVRLGLASWEGLSLSRIFAVVFAPGAILMGVPTADVPAVADLLGTKLVANEFVAYLKLTSEYRQTMSPDAFVLSTYALTGFANFGSIGILLGGIGGMAPTRRGDLARLSSRALLAGFLATMINAAIASALI
jgi:CNT family concentrative nucleoside transporter